MVVITVAFTSLLLSVGWRNGSWKAQVVAGLPTAFVITVLVALAIHFFRFVPEDFPRTFNIRCWLVIFSLVVAILARPKGRWDLRLVSGMAIPPTKSEFQALEAEVTIPPVWLHNPEPELPVIELIVGYLGQPSDWTRAADVYMTATDFASKHGGAAPPIVMPDANRNANGDANGDANGATLDAECVNRRLGTAETHLTQDAPACILAGFNAATGAHPFVAAGLSAGGTCATVLALRNAMVLATYSGYNVEAFESGNQQSTIAALFNGSIAEFNAHNPTILLTGNKSPSTSGCFEAGQQIPVHLSAANQSHTLTDETGLAQACLLTPNGGSTFSSSRKHWKTRCPGCLGHSNSLRPRPNLRLAAYGLPGDIIRMPPKARVSQCRVLEQVAGVPPIASSGCIAWALRSTGANNGERGSTAFRGQS